jgi:hypothetical protein
MIEGFEPTAHLLQLYLDWKLGLVSESNLLKTLRFISISPYSKANTSTLP